MDEIFVAPPLKALNLNFRAISRSKNPRNLKRPTERGVILKISWEVAFK